MGRRGKPLNPTTWTSGERFGRRFTHHKDTEDEHKRQSPLTTLRLCGGVAFALSLLLTLLSGCGGVITPEQRGGTPTTVPSSPLPPPPDRSTAVPLSQPTFTTATPTVTPTPIIHVVQRGETLSGIAALYGVSVEALQVVNGIENPLLLREGQELVIPTGEEDVRSSGGLLLPTPTPLPVGVRGLGFYETPVGSLDCYGEVVNTTPYTVTNVLVRVTLFDGSGNALLSGEAFAAADLLLPSGRAPFDRAPFRILFLSPPPDFASHQVTVLRSELAGALAENYVPLVVPHPSGTPSGSQFEVAGEVRNDDPERTVGQIVVVVTTYDQEGRVNGFRQQTLAAESLAPGETAALQLVLTTYDESPADFSVVAYGQARPAPGE
ncbi:MAG TPA: LysM domain-containing protein [Anaerolineales bacterium]|nr:LysM domain-containing protein [Anaerolineales bacterium]